MRVPHVLAHARVPAGLPAALLVALLIALGVGPLVGPTAPGAAHAAGGPALSTEDGWQGEVERAVADAISVELPGSGAPGVAWAVVEGDEVVTGASGVIRAGGDEPVTEDTPFVLGSISKSITAVAVLQLVEAGRLDLDDELGEHLPAFRGTTAGSVTLRELLSHTSGWSTAQGNASHADADGEEDELARRVAALAEVDPAHAPGEWEYSNTNYQLLGRVVEVAGAESFEDYVASRVLEPLGMADSFVSDGEVHPGMATGHRPWFWTKRPMADDRATSRFTAPQGGVVASARDVARYLQTMMNGGDDVITAEHKELMMRSAGPASPYYGLGWVVDRGTVWHTGTSPGIETQATMEPATERGVVVLVNAGSGTGFAETTRLREAVTAAGLGSAYVGPARPWGRQVLFVALAVLPVGYLLSMVWAWRHRDALRRKRVQGLAGRFSLWFPLLTTAVAAWVILLLVPALYGSPIRNILLFTPDLGMVLVAGAVTGVAWAVLRLVLAHAGSRTAPDAST